MSRERRFHVRDLESDRTVLDTEQAHHLIHVLRLEEGAEIALFDGKGRSARGVVETIDRERVVARVLEPSPSRESGLELVLGVAVPKGDRMAQVVQKLTELGVTRIVPLLTDRGEVGEGKASRSLARYRRIALEACKQSGRSLVPEVDPPRALAEILEESFDSILLAQPGAPALPTEFFPGTRVLALVGPEGGFTGEEIALAGSASARAFGLGPRTLRSETAAIAVASLLQWLAGDLSGEDERGAR